MSGLVISVHASCYCLPYTGALPIGASSITLLEITATHGPPRVLSPTQTSYLPERCKPSHILAIDLLTALSVSGRLSELRQVAENYV
ncbi:hypothetical protein FA95DRAFT_405521 [Auriscalpium vulgare]|uniref:Uncharacterized protein n=1 Tax=Auriscalpium vulgare TaxID=40419 RepID=A0ACB8RIA4_9AGAM|nr:hypothetical protein FA95DRAFT_405521 [Auriscalpium vulgare]